MADSKLTFAAKPIVCNRGFDLALLCQAKCVVNFLKSASVC